MYLEVLHDKMANSNMEKIIIDKDKTKIIEKLDDNFFFNDYDAFLSSLSHTLTPTGSKYNSKLLFKDILDKKTEDRFLTKETLDYVINDIASKGIPIVRTTNLPKNLLT
jgi:hypothetical protein